MRFLFKTSVTEASTNFDDRLARLGIITDANINKRNRRINVLSICGPLVGAVVAVASISKLGFTSETAEILGSFFFLNILGIGIGLHRYFTHRSFKTSKVGRCLLGLFGSWSLQGPIARWVADHRRHHRFADQPLDPHSPYWIIDKPTAGIRGLWWSHFQWMLSGYATSETCYASDVLADPITAIMSRYYWWFALSGLALPALAGWIVGGENEAIRSFLWAGCFRVFVLHHLTWSVNSIGHRFGSRVRNASDHSRNNWMLGLLLLGEGFHSYHHKYGAAAVNRPVWADLYGLLLLLLERLGAVWALRRYPD